MGADTRGLLSASHRRAARVARDAAFPEIVAETQGWLTVVARQLVGDRHDAADLVQETYIRAWRALPRFRGDAQLSTWLYAICTNLARNHYRRRRTLPVPVEILPDDSDGDTVDPESWVEVVALRDQLGTAVSQLSPSLRDVVVLSGAGDLPHQLIAERLGISEAASKVRLYRARKQLRDAVSRP